MTRQEYLSQIWSAYPALPENNRVAGRIYSLDTHNSPCSIEILRDGNLSTIRFEKTPSQFKFLAEGDLISVTTEDEIVLLAPQLRPLPRREFDKNLLQQWHKYLTELRRFFDQKNFLDIQTPSLVSCPGTEPSLDVFSTELCVGSRRLKMYLPTSPELHLKKALALGAEKIFEIKSCFRNGEITERHQPEFLMLEWYRAFASLLEIKKDVVDLVQFMSESLGVEAPENILSFSVSDLFRIHCDFDFLPTTSLEELRELALRLRVDVHSAESIDDYFFLIFMDKIETQLPPNSLVFVEKYPPYQAALARLTEDGWGDRFEAYWKGLELCNAFNELNDPIIQKMRAREDLDKKFTMGKESVSLDNEFFQCLEAGMPPSGGIALGVERLFMSLTNQTQIKKLRVFPL